MYTPGVFVFRENEKKSYEFCKPFSVACIASAAYNLGKISQPTNYENDTKNKIRGILRIASAKGHDSVVLSAYGCGAFYNDSKTVARLFKEVLEEHKTVNKTEGFEFGGFAQIAFAIIDDHNSVGSNFSVFKDAFSQVQNSNNNSKKRKSYDDSEDVKFAKKLQQECDDAEFARQLSKQAH